MTSDFTILGLPGHPSAAHTATVSVSPSPACNTWDTHGSTATPPSLTTALVGGVLVGAVGGIAIGKVLGRRETVRKFKNLLSGGGKHK